MNYYYWQSLFGCFCQRWGWRSVSQLSVFSVSSDLTSGVYSHATHCSINILSWILRQFLNGNFCILYVWLPDLLLDESDQSWFMKNNLQTVGLHKLTPPPYSLVVLLAASASSAARVGGRFSQHAEGNQCHWDLSLPLFSVPGSGLRSGRTLLRHILTSLPRQEE